MLSYTKHRAKIQDTKQKTESNYTARIWHKRISEALKRNTIDKRKSS